MGEDTGKTGNKEMDTKVDTELKDMFRKFGELAKEDQQADVLFESAWLTGK